MLENQYVLLDCGDGRRLESFAGVVCDRVAPMAEWQKACSSEIWNKAELRFDREEKWQGKAPQDWTIDFNGIRFSLEPASNGQIGVFPEQQSNWSWITEKLCSSQNGLNVLNCFAHTGGSTLAAARAGARVTHVDAAKSVNGRARENAVISGLAEASVRWITEDAVKFMTREVKRNNNYDAIILDPPAFGRMGKKIWKFEKDMPGLLKMTEKLLSREPIFLLLTLHHTGWGSSELLRFVRENSPGLLKGRVSCNSMEINGEGNSLPLGVCLRVEY